MTPIVVSFGLDGIAQAGTQSLPNSTFVQCVPNQAFEHMPPHAREVVLTHDPNCSI